MWFEQWTFSHINTYTSNRSMRLDVRFFFVSIWFVVCIVFWLILAFGWDILRRFHFLHHYNITKFGQLMNRLIFMWLYLIRTLSWYCITSNKNKRQDNKQKKTSHKDTYTYKQELHKSKLMRHNRIIPSKWQSWKCVDHFRRHTVEIHTRAHSSLISFYLSCLMTMYNNFVELCPRIATTQ